MPYACAVDHSASSRYAGSQIVNAIDASDRGCRTVTSSRDAC